MKAIADQDGKVWVIVPIDTDQTATIGIGSDHGIPFQPGQVVEIADERLRQMLSRVLAPFGAETVAITESALMEEGGLTPGEQKVMNALVAAWSAYQHLPCESEASRHDDLNDFRRAIHEAQRILATRVTARDYPGYWQ